MSDTKNISSLNHSFDVQNAIEYGVDIAILIHHFQFWISYNARQGKNYIEEKTWMYQTQKEMASCLPYYSEKQVKRLIALMVEKGILTKGNFNRSAYDRTQWYSFKNEEKFSIVRNRTMENPERDNGLLETVPPIPDTKTETKTNSKKGNDFDTALALPFISEETKFPLKSDQQKIFDDLKGLDLECDDSLLNILIRTHSEKNLLDCIDHLKNEISKGTKFKKSKIAFLRACLSGKISLITKQEEYNRKFAKNVKEGKHWEALEIHEKYMKCSKCHKEVPFNAEKDEFESMLKALYQLSKIS